MLDAIPALSLLNQAPSPRLINTHLSFRYKIVHFVRNPKDVCVSYFYVSDCGFGTFGAVVVVSGHLMQWLWFWDTRLGVVVSGHLIE